ncbi:protein translocase SEC61 complex subunit gamma [Candidatus Micrarchaeota archaeon]|nr:protein translocase SEC61 complex subunit gamma [Candidatus Micrarchaeota archaeon]
MIDIGKYLKILRVAKKPDNEEFSKIAKITAAGMIGIGLIGVGISFVFGFI